MYQLAVIPTNMAMCIFNVAVAIFFWLSLNERSFAKEQQQVLESARAHGRGNTYVAAYDSDEATRMNPATLAEAEKLTWQIRWSQADFFLGENTVSLASDLASLSGESSAVDVLTTFADTFGKRQYGRFQMSFLSLRILYFELSPFFSTTNFVEMRLPTTPVVEFRSDTLIGMNISMGIPFGKEWTLGVTVRPTHRTLFTGDLAFADVLDFVDNSGLSLEDFFNKEEGFPVGLDVGGIYRPSKEMRFGLLVENLGYAGDQGGFKDPPPPLQQRINLGMLTRWDFNPWHFDWFTDLQDIVNPNNHNYFRLLHTGAELGRNIWTRDHDVGAQIGINEGYFTFGAFLDAWLARLQATYYAVELGEYPGQRKDRRYAFSLQTATTF